MSASVVPARAGMSLLQYRVPVDGYRGPRASGDEPNRLQTIKHGHEWSPRERG